MVSAAILGGLPDLAATRVRLVALAALEAILCAEPEFRYYSFDPEWSPTEAMGSMSDDSGNSWFALCGPGGTALLGLDHEASTFTPDQPAPWVYDGLPSAFEQSLRREPAFDGENVTYCLWRLDGDSEWRCGAAAIDVEDGTDDQLRVLVADPEFYADFAADYYECAIDRAAVAAIYRLEPASRDLITALNPDADLAAVTRELIQIGYPGR